MAATEPGSGTLEQLTGDVIVESAHSATRVHYKRQDRMHPRDVPAEAVERIRARLDEIGAAWTPSVDLDVEEMLRGA